MEDDLCVSHNNPRVDGLIVPGPDQQTPLGSAGTVEVPQPSRISGPPVHRIAIETLSEIFLFLTPPLEIDGDWIPLTTKTEAPLLLCQICSSWREVAIGLPWLWTSIPIHANTEREMLDTWLARAKTLPLSLYILGDNDTLIKVMDPLSPRVSQCQIIRYSNYPAHPLVSLFQVPSTSMIYLESINISVLCERGEDTDYSYHGLDTTFEFCPCLRYVRLESQGGLFDLRTLRLPWSQLVVLSLSGVRCALDTTSLLRQLANLEELSLFIYDWEFGVVEIPSTVYATLPKLFRLVLEIWVADNMTMSAAQVYDLITVPKLTDFCLEIVTNGDFDLPEFDEMKTRSTFALEKLTLKHVSVGFDSDIIEFFQDNPSIWFLEVEKDDRDSEFWHLLNCDGKEPLLPLLRELRYSSLHISTDLVEMVESRWWPGDSDEKVVEGVLLQRLTSVYLEMENAPKAGLKKRLLKCKQEGLVLYLEIQLEEYMWV